MIAQPCRPERVLRFVFGPCSDEERDASALHFETCTGCRNDLEAIARLAPGTEPQGREVSGAARADLIAYARATDIANRRRAAEDVVALANHTHAERLELIYHGIVAVTPALATAMLEEGERILRSAPRLALDWFAGACLVADTAAGRGSLLSHELRVEAWKNYAWLLSYLGEYEKAEDALDWADDAAEQCVDQPPMQAIVQLSRGILLSQMERHAEALPFVVAARETFAEYGDKGRWLKALEQEANIRMKSGDAGRAVALLTGVIDLAADDLDTARRCSNIADALQMVGALWVAGEYLNKARSIHEKVGATAFLHHNTWVLARIVASAGRVDEALAHFEECSAGFREIGSADHAIRVDLDWSEIQLEHDLEDSATYDRLRIAASFAIEKGLPMAKCRALEYLRSLGQAATASHIRHVKAFMTQHDSDPHLDFAAPGKIA